MKLPVLAKPLLLSRGTSERRRCRKPGFLQARVASTSGRGSTCADFLPDSQGNLAALVEPATEVQATFSGIRRGQRSQSSKLPGTATPLPPPPGTSHPARGGGSHPKYLLTRT